MDREQRLAHGMTLIPRLADRVGEDVDARLRPLYRDIEHTLRVPFVNFVFRMLANYPDYFQPAWAALAPRLQTREFEQAADRLRASAVSDLTRERIDTAGLGDDGRQAVVDFNDSIHYVLPKLLLTATALDIQLEHPDRPRHGTGDTGHAVDAGVAEGTLLLPLIAPADADAGVDAVFADIRQCHGHPGVASYYRGLANYPPFLETAWARVRAHIDTDAYRARKQSVLTMADELAPAFVPDASSGASVADHDDVRAILAVFRYCIIPDILLDACLIKVMVDGPEAARRSRFSIA